ncbi:MAG: ribosomal RNA small subunit methyltransferase A [candidate division Zixibacteria bacterium]|nr:ribosomal RNA small subunit methyltransferase A [candidate division Zixibacteria bacterium]
MRRKALSQYFLTNSSIASKIAESLGSLPDDAVVIEIGGGSGILTEMLVSRYKNLVVVEIDEKYSEELRKRYSENADIKIINEDILKLDPLTVSSNKDLVLCGNIPYHITGLILRWISEHHNQFQKVVLMVQKEVAQRITCGPGKRDYGILSIILGLDFETEYLFTVDAEMFSPVPKVDSGVVRLKQLSESRLEEKYRESFIKIIKTAFSQRRKKLRNTLRNYNGFDFEVITDIFNKSGIDPNLRPEKLTIDEFIRIFNEINFRMKNK